MQDPSEVIWRDAAREASRAARARGVLGQDVNDVAQDAVERLLRSSLPSSPALVHRVVANRHVSELRRQQVRSRTLHLVAARALRAMIAAPPRLDVLDEYELTVAIAVDVLSKSDLSLMLLVDRDGVPLRQAARHLGIPASTASNRLERARAAVRHARMAHRRSLRDDSRRAS